MITKTKRLTMGNFYSSSRNLNLMPLGADSASEADSFSATLSVFRDNTNIIQHRLLETQVSKGRMKLHPVMKNLLKNYRALFFWPVFFLLAPYSLVGQLQQQVVGDKFDLTVFASDTETNIILRNNGLEFSSTKENQQDVFYLIFDKAEIAPPVPGTIISTSSKKLDNPAMAEVLNATQMTIHELSSSVYQNLYLGVDLKVEGSDEGLILTFSAKSAVQLKQIAFHAWGGKSDVLTANEIILHGDSASYRLHSDTGKFTKDENGICRILPDSETITTLTLTLNK